jgi:hypothetical protein
MSLRPLETSDDPDLRLSLPAMRRAARQAREIARKTNTFIIVGELGRVLRMSPEDLDRIEAERRTEACLAGEAVAAYTIDKTGDGK